MSNVVQLPSGMILDLERIIFIGKDSKNIGQWVVFMANAEGTAPVIDGKDLDALKASGQIKVIQAPPQIHT